tara:strand:- start:418 stop:726 length:309 start_codon:yes stop_codon:yes gene_type:complete
VGTDISNENCFFTANTTTYLFALGSFSSSAMVMFPANVAILCITDLLVGSKTSKSVIIGATWAIIAAIWPILKPETQQCISYDNFLQFWNLTKLFSHFSYWF